MRKYLVLALLLMGLAMPSAMFADGTYNTHDYVDLRLPSGTLWAKSNILSMGDMSASSVAALYFAWGEVASKSDYSSDTYTASSLAKDLSTKDNDAAIKNWGGLWRTPSYTDCQELISNCTWVYMTWPENALYSGWQVTGPNGHSIFILKNSVKVGTNLEVGATAVLWTSTYVSSAYANSMLISETEQKLSQASRQQGRQVRPVFTPKTKVTGITVSPDNYRLKVGETMTLTATVTPSGATIKDVTWSSSNTSVATVSTSGVVTGIAPGRTLVIAESCENSSLRDTCVVTVYNNAAPAGVTLIDLGLPSGTLWADTNLDGYYAWGEVAEKTTYNWSSYEHCQGKAKTMKKYCTVSTYGTVDNKTVLEDIDDVANVLWGEDYRIPTNEQVNELFTNCTFSWTTQNSQTGCLLTSKTNGKTLFLPALGYMENSEKKNDGAYGLYWERNLNSGDNNCAMRLNFTKDGNDGVGGLSSRYIGRSIRPVGTTVAKRVTSLTVTPTTLSMVPGGTAQLTATISPDDAAVKTLSWSSSNAKIATVSNGLVTAVGGGSCTITVKAMDGSGLTATCAVTVTSERTIKDQEAYSDDTDHNYSTLTYDRTFSNNEWQSLYVPFSMDYDEWKDKFDIAMINNMHQYDMDNDGVFDKMQMEVLFIRDGALLPNYPYVIRYKEKTATTSAPVEVVMAMKDKTLYAAPKTSTHITCQSMLFTYDIYGIYANRTITNASGERFFSSGKLCTANSSVTLKPQRWYMSITSRGTQLMDPDAEIKVVVFGEEEEEETTGITEVTGKQESADWYDLSGRKISHVSKPGIYIRNGRKVVVK